MFYSVPQAQLPRHRNPEPGLGSKDRLVSHTNTHGFAAENALKEEAKKPKYSLSLLSIVSTAAQPLKTRLAAALAFKNFIRHNYVVRTTDMRPARTQSQI